MSRREIDIELVAAAELAAQALPVPEDQPVAIDWFTLAHTGRVLAAEGVPGPRLAVALLDAHQKANPALKAVAASVAEPLLSAGVELFSADGQSFVTGERLSTPGRDPTLRILSEPAAGTYEGLSLGLPEFSTGRRRFSSAEGWTTSLGAQLGPGSWQALRDPDAARARVEQPDGRGRVARIELAVTLQCAVGLHTARSRWAGDLGALMRSLYAEGVVSVVRELLADLEPGRTRFAPWEQRPVTDALVGACCLAIEAGRFRSHKAENTRSVDAVVAAAEVIVALAPYSADTPTTTRLRSLASDLDAVLRDRLVDTPTERARIETARRRLDDTLGVEKDRSMKTGGGAAVVDFTLAATWSDPVRVQRDGDELLLCGVDRFVGAYLQAWRNAMPSH